MRSLALVLLAGCAARVGQDAHTGRDGTLDGATELRLDDRVEARGNVTYPGGDRVDWYAVRLAKPSEVRVELSWTSPRPGLRLGFDMFDADRAPLGSGAWRADGHLDNETAVPSDVVYIRVYARGRGDAGAYRLAVTRLDRTNAIVDSWNPPEIPDPPPLAAVPDGDPDACDDATFDPMRSACRTYCPTHAPPSWPACRAGPCPSPPDANNPACWASMPCPDPPDPRVQSCPKPASPPPVPSQLVRVMGVDVVGDEVVVRAAAGFVHGVRDDWRAWVVHDPRGVPVAEATIVRVDGYSTFVRAKLTSDQVKANAWVKLAPP